MIKFATTYEFNHDYVFIKILSIFFSSITDIGHISPFSYFSSPVFVGNQVQYLADEIPAQQAKSLPTVEISPKVAEILTPEEAVLPEVPDESSRFFTSDEVYYSSESQEAPDEDEEEIVFYYKDIEPASTPEDSVSYPLYPPLAPAPPLVGGKPPSAVKMSSFVDYILW